MHGWSENGGQGNNGCRYPDSPRGPIGPLQYLRVGCAVTFLDQHEHLRQKPPAQAKGKPMFPETDNRAGSVSGDREGGVRLLRDGMKYFTEA